MPAKAAITGLGLVGLTRDTPGPAQTLARQAVQAAIADAERRGLPELKVLLEGLAVSTAALRDAGLGGHANDR